MHRRLVLTAFSFLLTGAAAFGGCSSSSGNSSSSSGTDGGSSSGVVHKDSGGGGSSSSSGGSSSGTTSSGGDTGATCPDNTAFTPQPYATATGHKGVCTAADISAFTAACGDNGSNAACQAYQTSNTGDAGTACGNCIFDPTNAGATWVDQMGYFGPNYGACIQLLDPTNGAACATALDNLNDCLGFECDDCADSTTFQTCSQTVGGAGGVCNSYVAPDQTKCATDLGDGGVGNQCSPGAASGKQDPDWQFIINLICGGGSTGGGDAGGGG